MGRNVIELKSALLKEWEYVKSCITSIRYITYIGIFTAER